MACPELDNFDSADEVSAATSGAACDLATALGWCRLFDRKIDEELDGVLRLDMAKAAAVELMRRLKQWTEGVMHSTIACGLRHRANRSGRDVPRVPSLANGRVGGAGRHR